MVYSLEQYVKMMEARGNVQWYIDWISILNYVGHKIYNTRSKIIGTVKLDEYPAIVDEDGNDIPFCALEFKHGTVFGDWIYKIGEDYETLIMEGRG